MTLLFSSFFVYLSESVLAIFFCLGLWRACSLAVLFVLRTTKRRIGVRIVNAGPSELRRFALFQVVFVAVWSICFKACLYTTLTHANAHALLAKGQSLGIAIPAEVVGLLLILLGMVRFFVGVKREIDSRDGIDVIS